MEAEKFTSIIEYYNYANYTFANYTFANYTFANYNYGNPVNQ
jgi:hypothetical protein